MPALVSTSGTPFDISIDVAILTQKSNQNGLTGKGRFLMV
jgi:hypothetical protein